MGCHLADTVTKPDPHDMTCVHNRASLRVQMPLQCILYKQKLLRKLLTIATQWSIRASMCTYIHQGNPWLALTQLQVPYLVDSQSIARHKYVAPSLVHYYCSTALLCCWIYVKRNIHSSVLIHSLPCH